MAKAASVEFINVFKRYGNVTAVRDVSFKVEAGQLVTLLGPLAAGRPPLCALSPASNSPRRARSRSATRM